MTVEPLPVISLANGSVCAGLSYTINPNGAFTYTYSGGSAIVSPTVTSSYSVAGTSTAGCISATPGIITITVNPNPVISVNSGSICNGQTFAIIPSGASTYSITGFNFTVNPSTTTGYTVTGTDLNGCINSTPAISTVTVFALPTVTASSSNSLICINQSATLTASGANSYTWSNSSNVSSIVVSPTASTTYSVSGTDNNGCVNTFAIQQQVSTCTGADEMASQPEIRVYPNPANNFLFISSDYVPANIEIFNSLGMLVFQRDNVGDTAIDLSNWSAGIYYIVVKNYPGKTYKIMKE